MFGFQAGVPGCPFLSVELHRFESWFTNLEQTALNRCKPLPAPYKRLLNRKQ